MERWIKEHKGKKATGGVWGDENGHSCPRREGHGRQCWRGRGQRQERAGVFPGRAGKHLRGANHGRWVCRTATLARKPTLRRTGGKEISKSRREGRATLNRGSVLCLVKVITSS
ncbi:hypothetical protein Nepgr_027669 [Nepenthes gracilis]|uniref:Uncharacterized protein n=1 Tax=Nepenthes gracilis TaxID=150966 RepID=A0AAD3TAY4_NEPGR|nr:hypothetical protein Nepgr_027669 [Nepenthes gracilis]